MSESLFLIGLFAFFWFRGFPKKKIAYRLLLALFAVLSAVAAGDWAMHYVVGAHYFPDQEARPLLIFSALGVIGFAVFLGEIITLTRFKAAQKKEPNQASEPTR